MHETIILLYLLRYWNCVEASSFAWDAKIKAFKIKALKIKAIKEASSLYGSQPCP